MDLASKSTSGLLRLQRRFGALYFVHWASTGAMARSILLHGTHREDNVVEKVWCDVFTHLLQSIEPMSRVFACTSGLLSLTLAHS